MQPNNVCLEHNATFSVDPPGPWVYQEEKHLLGCLKSRLVYVCDLIQILPGRIRSELISTKYSHWHVGSGHPVVKSKIEWIYLFAWVSRSLGDINTEVEEFLKEEDVIKRLRGGLKCVWLIPVKLFGIKFRQERNQDFSLSIP